MEKRLEGRMVPNPPTEEMLQYWQSLGRFVDKFAHVERMTVSCLQGLAEIPIPSFKATFSSLRIDQAMGYINRVLTVTDADQATKDEFQWVFAQLQQINQARNTLLHYGTLFSEGAEFTTSNRVLAMTEDHVREIPISAEVLDQMTEDLHKISFHLLIHSMRSFFRDEPEEAQKTEDALMYAVGDILQDSWTYKPPSQSRPRRNKRTGRTKKKRAAKGTNT